MAKATDTFGIVLTADEGERARLAAAVDAFATTNTFPDKERFELQACLREALMAIVEQGFEDGDEHDIDIQMLFQRKRRILTIRIVDDGRTLNASCPLALPDRALQAQSLPPDDSRLGLVREWADQMSYFRQGRYNHLILSRTMPERPDSPAAVSSA